MTRLLLLGATLSLTGCFAFGEPLVGTRAAPDEMPLICAAPPECEEVREPPADTFEPPAWLPADDCDDDGVPDALDNCPGVPNPLQEHGSCTQAQLICDRLTESQDDLVNADLRGCVATVTVTSRRSLAGSDLGCAQLRFVQAPGDGETHWTGPADVDLSGAFIQRATLQAEGSIRVDVSEATLRATHFAFGARSILEANGALIEGSQIVRRGANNPRAASELRFAELTLSTIADSLIVDESGVDETRILLDRTELERSRVLGSSVDFVRVIARSTAIEAERLQVLGGALREGFVRTPGGAFAAVELEDVIFDECSDLSFDASTLIGVDIPRCPQDGLRLVGESSAERSRIAGGLLVLNSALFDSTLGERDSVIRGIGATLSTVGFCDLPRVELYGGMVECPRCSLEAFAEDGSLCATDILIRGGGGCGQLEFAPFCLNLGPTEPDAPAGDATLPGAPGDAIGGG